MSVTVTDLFCGAGGSSVGATAAGMTLAVAANHWRTAIDVHQTHFPDARHTVTPPVMTAIAERIMAALREAA